MEQDKQIQKDARKQIKKLPSALINQIAAGEIVERPVSIIKELLENSIDAEATQISIELEKGGKNLIRIVDNGIGLDKSQFGLVFERHATSKISSLQELEGNLNLGFRGEALAAIASVSKIEFASNGYSINYLGEIKPKAMAKGTQISVESLFYNVPARLKFLKTDATEYKQCLELVESYALCYPEVKFKLIHNKKVILDYLPQTKEERIAQVLGNDFSEKLLPIQYLGKETTVTGFIGKPETARDKAYNQYIFVNGRPINAPYFNHAIKQAFGSLIFPAEKPTFLIWISLNPHDVDMNVHPRKLEAKFHFQGVLYSILLKAVKQALESTSLEKTISLSKPSYKDFLPNSEASTGPTPQKTSSYATASSSSSKPLFNSTYGAPIRTNTYTPDLFSQQFTNSKNTAQQTTEPQNTAEQHFTKQEFSVPANASEFHNITPNISPEESEDITKPHSTLHLIGQLANSYLICESEAGVVFVDQHAAHERIMYQKLKSAKASQKLNTQKLLIPFQIQLSLSQMEILTSASSILNSIGFDIIPFGNTTIVVNAVPTKFSQNDLESVIMGLLQDLETGVDFSKLEEIEDIVINYAACRGAIKFGQQLTTPEQKELLREMEAIQHLQYSCPHGRPTKILITFDELEKQFKRK